MDIVNLWMMRSLLQFSPLPVLGRGGGPNPITPICRGFGWSPQLANLTKNLDEKLIETCILLKICINNTSLIFRSQFKEKIRYAYWFLKNC